MGALSRRFRQFSAKCGVFFYPHCRMCLKSGKKFCPAFAVRSERGIVVCLVRCAIFISKRQQIAVIRRLCCFFSSLLPSRTENEIAAVPANGSGHSRAPRDSCRLGQIECSSRKHLPKSVAEAHRTECPSCQCCTAARSHATQSQWFCLVLC